MVQNFLSEELWAPLLLCEVNWDSLNLCDQWETFECNGHKPSVPYAKWPLSYPKVRRAAGIEIKGLIWVSSQRALKSQPFNRSVASNPRCQSENIEMKYKPHTKLAHESHTGTCFQRRTKNQPSNSTSCSDNALSSLVAVARKSHRKPQATSSFSTWDCILKELF